MDSCFKAKYYIKVCFPNHHPHVTGDEFPMEEAEGEEGGLSLIHISEPTRLS